MTPVPDPLIDPATLVLGAYAFTCTAFVWAWSLYRQVNDVLRSQGGRLDDLWVRVTNHQTHELEAIRERLDRLEERPK